MLRLTSALVASFALLHACKPQERSSQSSAPSHSETSSVDAAAFRGEVHFASDGRTLVGWLLKPSGEGPFPAIVYNHGSEKDPSLEWMGDTASFFQAHGYAAFFPFRRGTIGSEGPYWKDAVDKMPASQQEQATIDALDAESADVVAAIEYVAAQPFVDARRVAVAGCSFGGIHTLLAAEKPNGVNAAVDFAGASFSWATSPLLQQRLMSAVDATKTPVFFLQAENDHDTTPSKELSAEMTRLGKPNREKIYPPNGKTEMAGHAGFCNHGQAAWGEDVLAFLRDAPPAPK